MAAVMAAGMTPPLGMALATAVRKKLWTEAERENGLACWLLGASFITEGAIPFAAAHPLRVIPSCMVGSAVTGALVMAFGNELRAPHGGIWVLPLISNPILYLLAIAVGTVITAGSGHRADEPGQGRRPRRSRTTRTSPRASRPDRVSTLHTTAGAATMFVAVPAVCRNSPAR